MAVDSKHPETIALPAGYRADSTTGAVAVPIYQTPSYQFDSTEHAAKLLRRGVRSATLDRAGRASRAAAKWMRAFP